MWGEVLEEDLYDSNTPFYDDELARREMVARQKKLDELQQRYPDSREGPGSKKLKRKVIYVYENNDG